MKKILILLLFLVLICFLTDAQESILYNSKGELILNSNYKVKKRLLPQIVKYEQIIHNIYKNIKYPEIAYKNGTSWTVIAKLHIDKKRLSIWCENVESDDPTLGKSVQQAVYKEQIILFQNTIVEEPVEIYLPIKFEIDLDFFKDEIKKNKAIRIKKHYSEGGTVLL